MMDRIKLAASAIAVAFGTLGVLALYLAVVAAIVAAVVVPVALAVRWVIS